MAEHDSDVMLVLTLRDGDRLDLWSREARSRAELAAILRRMADQFESGEVRRIE